MFIFVCKTFTLYVICAYRTLLESIHKSKKSQANFYQLRFMEAFMKIRRIVLLGFILVVCALTTVFGQTPQTVFTGHDKLTIKSTVLNEDRTVLVRVPANYAQSKDKFPVVYMLDGNAPNPSMMTGIIEQQAWSGMMPEMILVSIQNTNRTRDMTPTKTELANSGGCDKFLQFIETEVIPLVEKNYRTHPYRIFAGHSFGGLTVVYAFLSRPDVFNGYIAASPVLHWDNNFPIKRAEEVFKQNKDWKKTMFIALGDEPAYTNGFNSFKELLDRTKPKNFDYELRQMTDENHGSIVLRAYHQGLRKIFEGWSAPQTNSLADLENNYKKLTDKFGYKIQIPENLLNQTGYRLLNANRMQEAIEVFKKNVELYPNSANVYDSLGEALERDNQLELAKQNYEKGLANAERNGENDLAKTIRENLQRVSGKIKPAQ